MTTDFRFRTSKTVGSPSSQGAGGIETLASHVANIYAHPQYMKKTFDPSLFDRNQHLATRQDHAPTHILRAEVASSKLDYELYKNKTLVNDPDNYLATQGIKPYIITAYVLNKVLTSVGIDGTTNVLTSVNLVDDINETVADQTACAPTWRIFLKLWNKINQSASSSADYVSYSFWNNWKDTTYQPLVDSHQLPNRPGLIMVEWAGYSAQYSNAREILKYTDTNNVIASCTWPSATEVSDGSTSKTVNQSGSLAQGPAWSNGCKLLRQYSYESNTLLLDPDNMLYWPMHVSQYDKHVTLEHDYTVVDDVSSSAQTKNLANSDQKMIIWFGRIKLTAGTTVRFVGSIDDTCYIYINNTLVSTNNGQYPTDVSTYCTPFTAPSTGFYPFKLVFGNHRCNGGENPETILTSSTVVKAGITSIKDLKITLTDASGNTTAHYIDNDDFYVATSHLRFDARTTYFKYDSTIAVKNGSETEYGAYVRLIVGTDYNVNERINSKGYAIYTREPVFYLPLEEEAYSIADKSIACTRSSMINVPKGKTFRYPHKYYTYDSNRNVFDEIDYIQWLDILGSDVTEAMKSAGQIYYEYTNTAGTIVTVPWHGTCSASTTYKYAAPGPDAATGDDITEWERMHDKKVFMSPEDAVTSQIPDYNCWVRLEPTQDSSNTSAYSCTTPCDGSLTISFNCNLSASNLMLSFRITPPDTAEPTIIQNASCVHTYTGDSSSTYTRASINVVNMPVQAGSKLWFMACDPSSGGASGKISSVLNPMTLIKIFPY